MPYLIKRVPQGDYVARPGSFHSYTKDIRQARQFKTLQDAGKDKCENECVTTFEVESNRTN